MYNNSAPFRSWFRFAFACLMFTLGVPARAAVTCDPSNAGPAQIIALDARTTSQNQRGEVVADGYLMTQPFDLVGEHVVLDREARYRIDIVARGTFGLNSWPTMLLMVDGVRLDYKTSVTSASLATYTLGAYLLPAGSRKIEVASFNGATGRLLTVSKVILREVLPDDTPVLTRGPLIENPAADPTHMQVRWWTDQSVTDSTLRYGVTPALGRSVRAVADCRSNKVSLTGLLPNTMYFYQIVSGGEVLANGSFRTMPAAGSAAAMSFAAIGDFGINTKRAKQVTDAVGRAKPSLLITLGDNAYPTGKQVAVDYHWLTPYAEVNANTLLYSTWGNHDDPDVAQALFSTPGNGRYYSFDAGDAHFIVLDSNQRNTAAAMAAQSAWLEADLAATPRKWKLVFLHHAMYKCGNQALDEPKLREAWGPIFEKHNVDLVFAGHEHNYSRSGRIDDFNASGARGADGNTTVYIAQGSSGGGTSAIAADCPGIIVKSRLPSYTSVNLSGNTLRVMAVGINDAIIDDFTLQKE